MKIEITLDADGEWRACGPNKHYRPFTSLSELPVVVEKLIEDHIDWLKQQIARKETPANKPRLGIY